MTAPDGTRIPAMVGVIVPRTEILAVAGGPILKHQEVKLGTDGRIIGVYIDEMSASGKPRFGIALEEGDHGDTIRVAVAGEIG